MFVVRALVGGEIVTADVSPIADQSIHHASNRFASGLDIDLTRDQFADGETPTERYVPEARIAAHSGMRAQLLLERVQQALGVITVEG